MIDSIFLCLILLYKMYVISRVVPQQSKADDAGPELISADMKRELERQKWEKEAEEALKGPVHYSNVQFNGQLGV